MPALALGCALATHVRKISAQAAERESNDAAQEAELLSDVRQLTFAGRRSGEGYFNAAGDQMVFQSEREPGNPFFQIYLMDLTTGDERRISPGVGKTTCAWIHPDGDKVLFASTHEDPEAPAKQTAELEARASGQERRYSWDYDENYDLFAFDLETETYRQLTDSRGYDAEGSYSPDGRWIVFASNRQAYERKLTEREEAQLEIDQAYFNELYRMPATGGDAERLTDAPGYDGGPFFSPDGARICWRRFSADGATAEIMTANVDGSNVKQLTQLGAMSWAPYFHPSGDYLIFTTNLHGFGNFELYLVDAAGEREPVRVTYTDGFDGLPVFTPDGEHLAWTAARAAGGASQIFIGDWDDATARRLLRLDRSDEIDASAATTAALETAAASGAEIRPQDVLRHVDYLCRPELEGRLTGTPGERLATAYVAAYFEHLGLEPAGDDGTYFQEFDLTTGADLGEENSLVWKRGDNRQEHAIDVDWRPLAFSATGAFDGPLVFAGYGIAAPAGEGIEEYDSYVHLDVQDKWVVVLRYMPEDVSPETRRHWSRHASLRYKAMVARDRGAAGLVVVSGPNSGVREELAPLTLDGSLSGSSLPVISVTDETVERWVPEGKMLADLQTALDAGEPTMGFDLEGELSALIDVKKIVKQGRNVLARLPATEPTGQSIVFGAHVDHLGRGAGGSSLAKDDEKNAIHFGADDNASGTAGILEAAQWLASLRKQGKFPARRDVLFAAWSGEELGLLGSAHFVKQLEQGGGAHHSHADHAHAHQPHESESHEKNDAVADHQHAHQVGGVYPNIAACLNMDMVGRLEDKLVLQGVGSSSVWPSEIERRNAPVGLAITIQNDSYLPTDASSFYLKGVPILSAFTGSHEQYHTPRDTPDRLNYEGAARTTRLMTLITRALAQAEEAPDFIEQAPPTDQPRAALRAYLGTIPDYAAGDVKGVLLSGVAQGGPAATAGVKGGDVIVELAGKKIENIYDYTYAIEALKIGETTPIVVQRGEERIELTVTPGSRE